MLNTTDEAWIHYYSLKTKEQSEPCVEAGRSAQKKTKSRLDYLGKIITINGEFFAALLEQLKRADKSKIPKRYFSSLQMYPLKILLLNTFQIAKNAKNSPDKNSE